MKYATFYVVHFAPFVQIINSSCYNLFIGGINMFCDRLKALREDNDLTQSELAKALHISRETISGYENNNRVPSFDIAIKIADYFDVSLDYLFCRTSKNISFKKLNAYIFK